jgi:hypothetical protein
VENRTDFRPRSSYNARIGGEKQRFFSRAEGDGKYAWDNRGSSNCFLAARISCVPRSWRFHSLSFGVGRGFTCGVFYERPHGNRIERRPTRADRVQIEVD